MLIKVILEGTSTEGTAEIINLALMNAHKRMLTAMIYI